MVTWFWGAALGGADITGVLPLARRRMVRRRLGRCGVAVDCSLATGIGRSDGQETDGRRSGRGRLRRLVKDGCVPGSERWLPVLIGVGAVAVVGGLYGLTIGLALALAARRWLSRVRASADRKTALEQDRLARQLPLTAELLAAYLGSCAVPGLAAAAVAESVGSPMRERLLGIAAELSLGAPPENCWARLADDCPALAPLARCLARTSLSGTPPMAPLIGLAQAERASASRVAHARVRRAGVLATAPLGLCFLPAFVLIGIVPVVTGLTTIFADRI